MKRARTVALITASAALAAAPVASAQSTTADRCSGTKWIGSWTANPVGSDGTTFHDQTLRLIVSPHHSGSTARIRLSNRFGDRPTTFAAVSVAARTTGPAVDAATRTPVTFGGDASVTIAPGADAISDPVGFEVTAFKDMAVSLAVHGTTGYATTHYDAAQTLYVTPPDSGDRADNASGDGFDASGASWYFLSELDVVAPAATGVVVTFGDSLSDGGGSQRDANQRYPDFLALRLANDVVPLSVVSAGVSGRRLIAEGPFAPAAVTHLQDDVLSVPGVTDVVVLLGGNDIFAAPFHDAASVDAGLEEVVGRLRDAGLNVAIGIMPPLGAGSDHEGVRRQVNTWIRSGRLGVAIADFDTPLRAPGGDQILRPAYDSGDYIHPNGAGNAVMAAAVPASALLGTGCVKRRAGTRPTRPGVRRTPRQATRLSLRVRRTSARTARATGSLGIAGKKQATCPTGLRLGFAITAGRRTLTRRSAPLRRDCSFTTTVRSRSLAGRTTLVFAATFGGSSTLKGSERSVRVSGA